MGQGIPPDLDRDRRCRSLEAVQNTAEEAPRRAYCGDTASRGGRETHRSTHQTLYRLLQSVVISLADTNSLKIAPRAVL